MDTFSLRTWRFAMARPGLADAEAHEVLRLLAQGCRPQEIALMRGVPVRRIYWVGNKLGNRFGAETNERLIARAAEEGFFP